MSNLPSGTVTFLFTDIEGSTKLAQEYPDAWEVLRERHHAILQSVMDAHNGFVFQIIGDAFCVAFHTAGDALKAALKSQQHLQDEPWGEVVIRVRMGIHTGEAELHENEYRGYLTMAKVQRVMSVAYGGQVLLSNASAELLHGQLQDGITLRDMKDHRLKGLIDPERLWQLVAPDLRQDYPPLQSLKETPNNLPLQLTSFIGREKEVGQLKQRLEKNRLVTLTGSGGVGKTRLSIQVASELLDEYPNGVWLVELAPITDPALVTQTVCAALDVTPQGNASALNVLTDYLKPKKILLVVDNCEHLIDPAAQLCEALLHAFPNVRIIASSREALGIDGENAYRVPSLSLPNPNDGLQTIEKSEAVKLFMERATATSPEFDMTEANASVVAQICQRLDGIALAIELAASRVKLLKVEQIASRLDDVFRLLTGGSRTALPRQQTLRGAIEWSYNLLSEEERIALTYLSVFVGGWTLGAAEAVCDNPNTLNVLTHLVDKSLVAVDYEHGEEIRYFLLETIRQYAREKLAESGEGEQIRARHLDYYLKLAQMAEPELKSAGQTVWLLKLENENENINAALEWSIQGNATFGRQLAASLHWYWQLRGNFDEGYAWLRKMLLINPTDETFLHAKLLYATGQMAWMASHRDEAMAYSKDSEALFEKLGHETEKAFPLSVQGWLTIRSDFNRASQLFSESLSLHKRAGNTWGILDATSAFGNLVRRQGNLDQAWQYYEESLSLAKEIKDRDKISFTLLNIGGLAEEQGEYARAEKIYEEALQYAKESSRPVMAWALRNLGIVRLQHRDYERSRLLFEETLEINRKMGDRSGGADTLNALGWCARLHGDFHTARLYYSEGLDYLKETSGQDEYIAGYLIDIGVSLGAEGYPEKFSRLLGMAEGLFPIIIQTFIPFSRTETEQYIETARAALGDEAYTAAYEFGKQMSLDEAVAYALKELGQPAG